jgi:hypothetical protein
LSRHAGTPFNARATFDDDPRIGGYGYNSEFSLDGQLDEFRLWHGARTAQEIADSMDDRLVGTQPNLAVSYSFENVANGASGVYDASGNGHHGTLETWTVSNFVSDGDALTLTPSIREDQTLVLSSANRLNLTVSDVDDTTLTINIQAAHGSLSLATLSGLSGVSGNASGNVTFTGAISAVNAALDGLIYAPSANYSGLDQIVYSVDDGDDVAQSTTTVEIAPVNDVPVAAAASILVNSGSVPALGAILEYVADPDGGDSFNIVSVANASHGTAALNGGNPVFTPDAGYTGMASFKYWISDAASPSAPGTFGAQTAYSTGSFPQTVAAADFNGDGKVDLVTANATGNSVSLLLGNGNGTFQSQSSISAGTSLFGIVAGDFNNDGKMDFAVTSYTSNQLYVALGNGNGTFQSLNSFGVGTTPVGLMAADFNGDGNLDLATANSGGDTVSVMLGNGAGSFSTSASIAAGTTPYMVAAADLNNDGKIDIVIAERSSNTVGIALGAGNGQFQTPTTLSTTTPNGIAVGDLNNDGIPDIAVSNSDEDTASVFLGVGDGTFGSGVAWDAGLRTYGVVIADFDQDGNQDLVLSNTRDPLAGAQTNSVSVLTGNGNGTFDNPVSYATGYDTYPPTVADLNGDGRPDIVAPNEMGANISVLLNTSAGGTQSSATLNLTVQDGTAIVGTSDNDIIVSSATNQTLTGNAGADNFVFAGDFGDDTITDFAVGTDQLSFDSTAFADVTALLAATTDSAGGAVITHLADTVTITNVTKAQLAAHTSDLHLI